MQARTWVLGLVAAAAGTLVAAPADASQWQSSPTSGFTLAAGDPCGFPLQGDVLADRERYRTTETFPDGSPKYQEYTGELIMRFTNLDTGTSVVRNLTGRGDYEYFADGSFTLTDKGGHFAAGLHAGDDPAQGFYVVGGKGWSVHFAADGHRTLTEGHGTIENLCDTLG